MDIAHVCCTVWVFYMQCKNAFRATEVGEYALLAVFSNIFTGTDPSFVSGVAAIGVLLSDALAVVAVLDSELFVTFGDTAYHIKVIIPNNLLFHWENARCRRGRCEGVRAICLIFYGFFAHVTNVKDFVVNDL